MKASPPLQNLLATGRAEHGLSLRLDTRGLWLTLNVAVLLAVALVFRFWKLENLPGINGDEAWYGIQAQTLLEGGQPACAHRHATRLTFSSSVPRCCFTGARSLRSGGCGCRP